MSTVQYLLDQIEQLEQKRWVDQDRLSMAASCLGSLQHLLRYPDAEDREARLAAIAVDLQVALRGDEVARAEVEAYRDDNVRRLLERYRAPAPDVPHRRGCVLPADHRDECRTAVRTGERAGDA